ncbi:hypothetical protein ACR2Y1_003138 [Morganella morganii]
MKKYHSEFVTIENANIPSSAAIKTSLSADGRVVHLFSEGVHIGNIIISEEVKTEHTIVAEKQSSKPVPQVFLEFIKALNEDISHRELLEKRIFSAVVDSVRNGFNPEYIADTLDEAKKRIYRAMVAEASCADEIPF